MIWVRLLLACLVLGFTAVQLAVFNARIAQTSADHWIGSSIMIAVAVAAVLFVMKPAKKGRD